MIMTRRSLFSLGAAALAGFALDPERALFVPGKKLISIPKPLALEPFHVQLLFGLGDIITIESFPGRYVVTRTTPDGQLREFKPAPGSTPPSRQAPWSLFAGRRAYISGDRYGVR